MPRPIHSRNSKHHSISLSSTNNLSNTSSRHSLSNLSSLNNPSGLSNLKSTQIHHGTSRMRRHPQKCVLSYTHLRRMIRPCHIPCPSHYQHRQWDTRRSTLAPNQCLTRSSRSFRPNRKQLTCRRLTRMTLNPPSRPTRLSMLRKRNTFPQFRQYHNQNLFIRYPRSRHSRAGTLGR